MHAFIPSPPGPRRAAPSPDSRASLRRCASGVSVLEVLFATVVLALTITTSITAVQRALLALDLARKITLAGQIMQSKFEEMRLESWSVICGHAASEDLTTAMKLEFTATAAFTDTFTLTRTIADEHADMKRITLTASWKTFDGHAYSRSYTTYYGRNGLYDYYYNSY